MPRCRSCPAQIRWVRTNKGGKMPLDDKPVVGGNIIMIGGLAVTLTGDELEEARETGERLWMPHWATCPKAKRHRPGTPDPGPRKPPGPPGPRLPL